MSYEGGGGAQGPAGPTGPTGADGATGGISFSGPNGAVLWYDGTAVTGTTGLRWYNGEIYGYTMEGGPSGNNFTFDDNNGNMQISFGQTDYGKQIKLLAGNTNIVLTDAITGEEAIAGNLSVIINGSAGASGDVLMSDGSITTWQALPTAGISFSGPTGAVLWYDGTAITGTTGLTWTETSTYVMVGGPSGNNFTFDNNGNMQIGLGQTDYGKVIAINAGNTQIVLTDAISGETTASGTLSVSINGSPGASGDVLTSDGSITTWQAPVTTLQQGKINLNSVTWTENPTSSTYYAADFPLSQPLYNNSNVIVTMIDSSDIVQSATFWIVNVSPNADGLGNLRIWLAGNPTANIYASWLITNPGSPD
jgi:hypothetical protein